MSKTVKLPFSPDDVAAGKRMSPNRPTTQELEDWVEILMRWIARYKDMYAWDDFRAEYPTIAAEMEEWLERQHEPTSQMSAVSRIKQLLSEQQQYENRLVHNIEVDLGE